MKELDFSIEDDGPPMAMDRRSYDSDNRLTVTDCVISAAQVNPYYGREIPGYESLGLDPDKIYRLYRDPMALKAAVPLFNGIPLLADHVAVSAADPQHSLQAGTVHDCRWSNGQVIGTVSIWDGSAIDGVESRLRKDLSAGYRYTVVMNRGAIPSGELYDGRMYDILPNHVALVAEGRVLGATVGDAAPAASNVAQLIPGYDRLSRGW